MHYSFTVSVSETTNNISIYGPHISNKNLYLSRGVPSQIHCETFFDTPQANVTWYTRGIDNGTRIFSSNAMLLYSNKSRTGTITLVPTDDHHDTGVYCCLEFARKYKVCSTQYNIIVKGKEVLRYCGHRCLIKFSSIAILKKKCDF